MPLRLEIEPHERPPPRRKIAQAAALLHTGGVAAYPTDTVYALGCAIESKKGAERIYRAKQMSDKQRLAVICPDLTSASMYAHFNDAAFRLARRIFPGPYTLVLPATREVPRLLLEKKRRQVGIRIPDHPIVHALVEELGRPMLTTSAIAPGAEVALSDADDVLEAFGRHVDVIIDGGPTSEDVSTVLEVADDGEVIVIREGLGPIEGILES